MRYANSVAGPITLNINNTGAKPIYINGEASSATNYSLPAGTYLVYYDGTNYHFRRDGKMPGSISGDAATVNGHAVNSDVPINAAFTDTTYSFSQPSNGKLLVTDNRTSAESTVDIYTLPLATSTTRGGVKIGYTQSGKNYPVQLSNEQMYVNVPWTNENSNYLTASDVSVPSTVPTLAWGGTTTIGEVADKEFKVIMPANPDTHYTSHLYAGSSTGTGNATTTNGATYLKLFDNSTAREKINMVGDGTVTVTSNNAGKITIAGAAPTVVNNNPTLELGQTSTIGTINNVELTATMPTAATIDDINTMLDGLGITLAPNIDGSTWTVTGRMS